MDLNEYQRQALRTAGLSPNRDAAMAYLGLGVAGEAGEVADYIKKVVAHGHTFDAEKLKKELGDVMWYVAVLSRVAGLDLVEVAEGNIAKLRERYPNGFESARSINRVENAQEPIPLTMRLEDASKRVGDVPVKDDPQASLPLGDGRDTR